MLHQDSSYCMEPCLWSKPLTIKSMTGIFAGAIGYSEARWPCSLMFHMHHTSRSCGDTIAWSLSKMACLYLGQDSLLWGREGRNSQPERGAFHRLLALCLSLAHLGCCLYHLQGNKATLKSKHPPPPRNTWLEQTLRPIRPCLDLFSPTQI